MKSCNKYQNMLTKGSTAPQFTLEDQHGAQHSLSEYRGKRVLLYFYPKDDTPGCTKEACTIAEVYDTFQELGVSVLGISKDSVSSHKKFAEKYNLPFTLLSDPTMDTIAAYGALKEKKMFGMSSKGTARISYLIAEDGTISTVYPNVDPATHAQELLQDLAT